MPGILSTLFRLLVASAVLGGVAAVGVTTTMRDSYPATAPGTAAAWPSPRPVPPGATVVAVVLGAAGSVVSDAMLPYEVFGRSSRFFPYTVSGRREPVPLSGGLRTVPEHTFDTAPAPDVVVVPAVVEADPELRAWIAGQSARGAYILGVCAGVEVLADAGVLDGRRATSFWQLLGSLRKRHPETTWLAGERYVEDGRIVTTAGVTSGLVGALRMVEILAGGGEAERIGRELAYPRWVAGGPTRIPEQRLAVADLPYALNAAFPWFRPVLAVGLTEGVGEIEVAAAFEIWSGSSFAARTVPVAATGTVTTRHGMLLLAETGPVTARRALPPASPGAVRDRPGALPSALAGAVKDRPGALPSAESGAVIRRPGALPSAEPGSAEVDRLIMPGVEVASGFSFDPLLRDLAEHGDRATARTTAKFVEYPADHLRLTGRAWPWRSTALAVSALILAIGAGLAPWSRALRLFRGSQSKATG